MKVTKFDRESVEQLSHEVVEALRPFAARRGLSVERRGGTYGDLEYTCRITFTFEGIDPHVEAFKKYGTSLGLRQDDLGKSFTANGLHHHWPQPEKPSVSGRSEG